MAVVGQATELNSERRGPYGQNNRRQYTRSFGVVVDNAHDGVFTVLSAVGVPLPYQEYQTATELDPGARVVRRDASPDAKSPLYWRVQIDYDTEYERLDGHPLLDPIKVDFDFEHYKEALPGFPNQTVPSGGYSTENDAAVPTTTAQISVWGGGITNSAGEPFDPPAERDASRPIITVVRNEPIFTVARAVQYINSVNKDNWSGLTPRQAMLRGIRSHREIRKSTTFGNPDIVYWPVTYVFAMRRETWDLQLLNIGTYYLSIAATFNQNDGSLSNSPAQLTKLDGSGAKTKVLLKLDGTEATDHVATFRRYRVYKEEPFLPLGINLNISGI